MNQHYKELSEVLVSLEEVKTNFEKDRFSPVEETAMDLHKSLIQVSSRLNTFCINLAVSSSNLANTPAMCYHLDWLCSGLMLVMKRFEGNVGQDYVGCETLDEAFPCSFGIIESICKFLTVETRFQVLLQDMPENENGKDSGDRINVNTTGNVTLTNTRVDQSNSTNANQKQKITINEVKKLVGEDSGLELEALKEEWNKSTEKEKDSIRKRATDWLLKNGSKLGPLMDNVKDWFGIGG